MDFLLKKESSFRTGQIYNVLRINWQVCVYNMSVWAL